MPDHIHILVGVFFCSLTDLMRDWKAQSGAAISEGRGVRGAVWQGRYFDYIPRQVRDFWEKLEYIHRNPLEAGLAAEPGQWKWSSENFYRRRGSVPIPVDEPHLPVDANAPLWPMHGKGRG